jgi:site-specific recombinase XerD
MTDDLEPLDPREAIDMYLDERRGELSERTLSTHYYRLNQFVEWLEAQDIDDMNDVTARTTHRYKKHRRDERGLAPSTVHGDFDTLVLFFEVLAIFDAVPSDLSDKVRVPTVTKAQGVSDDELEAERAERILDYMHSYDYASRDHCIFLLVWHVGMRTGGVRTIDLEDCELEGDAPGISLRHRPDTDTPLKNGEAGERDVNVSREVADVLQDYIADRRVEKVDEHGRRALFSTERSGRLSRNGVQQTFYRWTKPCEIGACPHDKDPETCDWTRAKWASKCPSTESPHAVRTGSITHQRNQGVPPDVVSARVNATEETITKHYDKRTHRQRMQNRREKLEDL